VSRSAEKATMFNLLGMKLKMAGLRYPQVDAANTKEYLPIMKTSQLGGKEFPALVDTGSDHALIRESSISSCIFKKGCAPISVRYLAQAQHYQ